MAQFNHNTGQTQIPEGTVTKSCSYNSGQINVGSNVEITKLAHNSGQVQIANSARIDTIAYNTGPISFGNNAEINCIKYNSGTINLGANSKVDSMKYNSGIIIAGPGSIVPSGKYNTGQITVLQTSSQKKPDNAGASDKKSTNKKSEDHSIEGGFQRALRDVITKFPAGTSLVKINESQFTQLLSGTGISVGDSGPVRGYAQTHAQLTRTPSAPPLRSDDGHGHIETSSAADVLETSLCNICMEFPRKIVISCGHRCCEQCSESISICHMCPKVIDQRIRIYD